MSPARRLVVRGATVVDATGTRRADVVVEGETVVAVGPAIDVPRGAKVLDASGAVVTPGLVDLHAHLRQPGMEEAETVETASRAAALGGYSAVVAMPNTDPPADCAAVVKEVLELGRSALVEVAVAGTITAGRAGERLAPLAEMAELGVRLFTDDGSGVQDASLMRRALDYGRGLGVTLAEHCEEATLAQGAMHEGAWSSRLGIPGVPAAAEEVMVARDLLLVATTGCPMHFLHLSTAGSVELLAWAKARGLPVTAEVTPHHLALCDAAVASYDPRFKVNPPLRTEADRRALGEALAAGVIDAVATDHAPHPSEAKAVPFAEAPPGMLGLETALGVCLQTLCKDQPLLGLERLVEVMSTSPAAIAGLTATQGGPVAPGRPANLAVFHPDERRVVEPESLASRSANTPFAGWSLPGVVRHTVVQGEPVVIDGEAQR